MKLTTFPSLMLYKKPLVSIFFALHEKTSGLSLTHLESLYNVFSLFPGENPLLAEKEKFIKILKTMNVEKLIENMIFLIKTMNFFDQNCWEIIEEKKKKFCKTKKFWDELLPLIINDKPDYKEKAFSLIEDITVYPIENLIFFKEKMQLNSKDNETVLLFFIFPI